MAQPDIGKASSEDNLLPLTISPGSREQSGTDHVGDLNRLGGETLLIDGVDVSNELKEISNREDVSDFYRKHLLKGIENPNIRQAAEKECWYIFHQGGIIYPAKTPLTEAIIRSGTAYTPTQSNSVISITTTSEGFKIRENAKLQQAYTVNEEFDKDFHGPDREGDCFAETTVELGVKFDSKGSSITPLETEKVRLGNEKFKKELATANNDNKELDLLIENSKNAVNGVNEYIEKLTNNPDDKQLNESHIKILQVYKNSLESNLDMADVNRRGATVTANDNLKEFKDNIQKAENDYREAIQKVGKKADAKEAEALEKRNYSVLFHQLKGLCNQHEGHKSFHGFSNAIPIMDQIKNIDTDNLDIEEAKLALENISKLANKSLSKRNSRGNLFKHQMKQSTQFYKDIVDYTNAFQENPNKFFNPKNDDHHEQANSNEKFKDFKAKLQSKPEDNEKVKEEEQEYDQQSSGPSR